jgi:zinc and cadmium transporter
MDSAQQHLLGYCVVIFLASLAGGGMPVWLRLTHTRMQLAMSLIGGLMLGVALLHLLPHAVVANHSVDRTAVAMVCGLMAMFFLIRIFHVHPHVPEEDSHTQCEHGLPHAHGHEHVTQPKQARSSISWLGLAIGLSLHTLIDGMALAASVAVERQHGGGEWTWGLGTFAAIVFHKPLDALSIATVMSAGRWSPRAIQLVNVLFALMCPLGALAFSLGLDRMGGQQQAWLGAALGFSAGVFLCIALSDLLPEVQFHTHDRVKLSAALLAGVVLAYLITFLEPEHFHERGEQHEGSSGQQDGLVPP